MNANELSFGIEIETTLPANSTICPGMHGRGTPVLQLPTRGGRPWLADRDPSIHSSNGRIPCEFVSPVYTGAAGIVEMLADIKAIKELGAEVNASCGLHIHVGFNRQDRDALARLTTLVSNFEKAIFASTGTKNRERGRWCGSVRRHGGVEQAIANAAAYRYHIVNLGSEHPTVEFRPFAASLNTKKIGGYVAMCLAIVERALNSKRVAKWEPKPTVETSPIHRSGEGQTQLTRFFYTVGWTKGRCDYVYGNVLPDGELHKTKRVLMEMARKYDAQL